MEYNRDLFEAVTVRRMLARFERLLSVAVADPEARVAELPLLSAGERQQLLLEWNDTAAVQERERCLHTWFEEQAARTPEAPAVTLAGEAWSYRDLDRRANRLAHHLRRMGVGPEVR